MQILKFKNKKPFGGKRPMGLLVDTTDSLCTKEQECSGKELLRADTH